MFSCWLIFSYWVIFSYWLLHEAAPKVNCWIEGKSLSYNSVLVQKSVVYDPGL